MNRIFENFPTYAIRRLTILQRSDTTRTYIVREWSGKNVINLSVVVHASGDFVLSALRKSGYRFEWFMLHCKRAQQRIISRFYVRRNVQTVCLTRLG